MNTYLIYDKGSNLIKIGKAKNVKNRLMELQVGCGSILEVLHVFYEDIESRLHRKLKSKRVQGEWFDTTVEEVMDVIRQDRYLNSFIFGELKPRDIILSRDGSRGLRENPWIEYMKLGEERKILLDYPIGRFEVMCLECGIKFGMKFDFHRRTGILTRVR